MNVRKYATGVLLAGLVALQAFPAMASVKDNSKGVPAAVNAVNDGPLQDMGCIWRFKDAKDGQYHYGFLSTDNRTYYFNQNGDMDTGYQPIEGKWYHFDDTDEDYGAMSKDGWEQILGVDVYFNADGTLVTDGLTPDGHLVDQAGRKIK